MKAQTLTKIIRKIASTVGRKAGIRVVFRGDKAETCGKVIYLPAMAAGTTLTDKEVSIFLGYLDHEIGHILHSDFDVIREAGQKGKLNQSLLNVLEDVREELLYIDQYPGSKSGLDDVCEKLETEFKESIEKEGEELGKLTLTKSFTLIYEESYSHRGRPRQRTESLGSFRELTSLIPLVENAVNSKSTLEAFKCSEQVIEILKKLFPEEFKSQNQPNMPTTAVPRPGKPGGKKSTGVGQGGQPTPDQDFAEALHFLLAVTDKSGAKAGGMLVDISKTQNKDDKSRPAPQGNDKTTRGSRVLPPATTEFDQVFYHPGDDLDSYNRTLRRVSTEVSMLKKSLHIYLKSRALKTYERGLDHGKLDSQSVWKIRAGEYDRLYKERRTVVMVDTAICMMIDLSGSMDRELTQMVAILCSEATMGVPKVKLQIAGFTTGSNIRLPTSADVNDCGRLVPLQIPKFKDYDEDGRKARSRIGALTTSNYTPLGEAFAFGYESLLDRKESKRVLWLITDGQPSFLCGSNNHNEYMLMGRIHSKCKTQGIDVVGLEIGRVRSLDKYVDVCAKVPGIAQLPQAVLEMIKSLVEVRRG